MSDSCSRLRRYHSFQDERNLYLVLEHVTGGILVDHLRKQENPSGRFSNDHARFYAAQVRARVVPLAALMDASFCSRMYLLAHGFDCSGMDLISRVWVLLLGSMRRVFKSKLRARIGYAVEETDWMHAYLCIRLCSILDPLPGRGDSFIHRSASCPEVRCGSHLVPGRSYCSHLLRI